MHEEISIPELTEVVARLSALLGPRQGGVLPLEGGITNRNFRVNFGGNDYVVRLPGKDTDLLGIDREAERLATKRAAELGIGPEGGRHARGAALPGHLLRRRAASMTAEELREQEALTEVARGLRAVPRVRPRAADRVPCLRDRARLRGGRARRAATSRPTAFDDALADAPKRS